MITVGKWRNTRIPMALRGVKFCITSLALTAALLHAERLPTVTSETLAGNKLDLPAGLSGHVAVLCVGFSHASQSEVKAWTKALRGQFGKGTDIPVYSVAVLEDAPRLVRGMIVHSMKSNVPPADQSKFLVIYKNEKELKQAAGFSEADDGYVMVLGPTGDVEYKYHGPSNERNVREVSSQIAEILHKTYQPK